MNRLLHMHQSEAHGPDTGHLIHKFILSLNSVSKPVLGDRHGHASIGGGQTIGNRLAPPKNLADSSNFSHAGC